MTCTECERPATNGLLCFKHHIGTVGLSYGHLRNRLYPGEPVRSTEKIIRAEAKAKGEDAVPAEWAK